MIQTVLQGIKQKSFIYNSILSRLDRLVKIIYFPPNLVLARSGSKPKLDKSQLPPTDDHSSSIDKVPRLNNPYVEVIGRGYTDEKSPHRRLPNETNDDKQQLPNKPRAKIIKGKIYRFRVQKKNKNAIIPAHLILEKHWCSFSDLICI